MPIRNKWNKVIHKYPIIKGFTSVIVPAYNRSDLLDNTLLSLTQQSVSRETYEIIVSNDGGNKSISQLCKKYQTYEVVISPSQGAYIARNKALEISRGQYIASADSDIIVPAQWIERGTEALQQYDYIGGNVIIDMNNPESFLQRFEFLTAYRALDYFQLYHFHLTGNMFVKRKVIEEIGGFDRRLQSSGDYEFGDRIFRCKKFRMSHVDNIDVMHPVTSIWLLIKKQRRLARGSVTLTRIYPDRFTHLKIPLYKRLLKIPVQPLRNNLFMDEGRTSKLLMMALQYILGIVRNLWMVYYQAFYPNEI